MNGEFKEYYENKNIRFIGGYKETRWSMEILSG